MRKGRGAPGFASASSGEVGVAGPAPERHPGFPGRAGSFLQGTQGPRPQHPRYLWLEIGAPGWGRCKHGGLAGVGGLGTCSGRSSGCGGVQSTAGRRGQEGRDKEEEEKWRQRERWRTDRKDAGTEGPDRGVASPRGGRGLNQVEAGFHGGEVSFTRQKLEWCLDPVGVASVRGGGVSSG